jgi:hypothetical protein
MTSHKKIISNRKNAKRSTGPSEEAKERTKMNALRHGLRSAALLLPGEDPQKLQELTETWVSSLKPRDSGEDDLVQDIVKAFWFNLRAGRAMHETLKGQIEQAVEQEDQSVGLDLRRLFWDAREPHCMYGIRSSACGGPHTSAPKTPEDPLDPSDLVRRLESSAKGCEALAAHWRSLRERAEQGLEWQSHDRLKAVRLLGRQPIEIVDDQRVWLIFVASFVLHPLGKKNAFEDFKTDMATVERPPFEDRIRLRWPGLLDESDTAKAKQALLDIVDRSLERLEAKLEVFRSIAGEQTTSRAGRLAFDQSAEGDRLRRYEMASHRRAHRCLDAFWKYRRENGDGEDGVEVEDAANSTPESGAANEAPSGEKKNLTSEAISASDAAEFAVFKELMARDEGIRQTVKEIVEGAELIKQVESGKLSIGELLDLARSPLLNPIPPG